MMDELRKSWELIDTNNISIRARYIRSAANVRADRLAAAKQTGTTGSSTPASSLT
jgi:hypothetical protein